MQDEEISRDITEEPAKPAFLIPPDQIAGDQSPPTPIASANPNDKKTESAELRDIAKGERFLIGVGVAGVCVNLLLGYVYILQLRQMTEATRASSSAAEVATEALQTTSSQFERSRREAIDQTISAIQAAKAAPMQLAMPKYSLGLTRGLGLNSALIKRVHSLLPLHSE